MVDVPTVVDAVLLDRYGPRRAAEILGRPAVADTTSRARTGRTRPGAVVGAVLGLAVVLGWVAWASAGQDTGSVSSQLTQLYAPGPHAVSVVFTAAGPAGEPLTCVLDATDRIGTVVGRAVVRLPAEAQSSRQVHARVATVALAVGVTVDGCQSPGQTGLH
jgi:hypothetical protein